LANTDLIQFSIDYDKKFFKLAQNQLCGSVTTIATLHTWTADFWAKFE